MFSQKAAAFRVDALLADSHPQKLKRQHDSTCSNKTTSEYLQTPKKFKYSDNSLKHSFSPDTNTPSIHTMNSEPTNKTDQNYSDQKINTPANHPFSEDSPEQKVHHVNAEKKTNEECTKEPKYTLNITEKTHFAEELLKETSLNHCHENVSSDTGWNERKKCHFSNSQYSAKVFPRSLEFQDRSSMSKTFHDLPASLPAVNDEEFTKDKSDDSVFNLHYPTYCTEKMVWPSNLALHVRTKFPGFHDVCRERYSLEKEDSASLLSPFGVKTPRRAPERQRTLTQDGVTVSLLHHELWDEFHGNQTEMIITKNGRRMFPVIKIRVFGLNPESLYMIYLDLAPLDGKRYRYAYPSSAWIVSGTGDTNPKEEVYIHPDSPSSGSQWMDMALVSFDKLKLTNNRDHESKGQIFLQSMQKYCPRVFIQRLAEGNESLKASGKFSYPNTQELLKKVDKARASVFSFVETRFITVTAYQNQKITRLKINSNPFAKGFRDTSKYKETIERHLMTSGPCGMPCCRHTPFFPFPPVPALPPPLIVPALPFHPFLPLPPNHHLRTAGSQNRWSDLVSSPNFSPPSFSLPPSPFPSGQKGEKSDVR